MFFPIPADPLTSMRTRAPQPEPEPIYRPWVDRTLRHIPDSVWRLRYLQAVAPTPPEHPPPRPFRWKPAFLAIACIFLVGAAPRHPRTPAIAAPPPRFSTPRPPSA